MLYIHHATVYTPERRIDDGAVLVQGRQILAVGSEAQIPCPAGAVTIDATGLYLAPGFVDLQINGAFGHDFTAEPDSVWPVAAQLPRYGVTSFLPTVITSPLETIGSAQEVVIRQPATGLRGARPLGLHLEGPFLNPERKGAHNPAHLRLPDLEVIEDWSPQSGVLLVTLAPELPGALDLIATLVQRGMLVSAGHSASSLEQAQSGFTAGIRYGTHLFNAMPPLHHRKPGLVGALLTDGRATAGIIADGIHCHPSMVALAWQSLGRARLNLVTDAMAALGMPPGQHRLAGFDVEVDGTSARLADGTLAGSVLSLDTALRNLMTFTGCSLEEALPTITMTPTQILGLGATRGRIAPGYLADLVLLTPDLRVQATIAEGKEVYRRPVEEHGP
jgi:N-acetylglucosamine-6-phosphate deacetylase